MKEAISSSETLVLIPSGKPRNFNCSGFLKIAVTFNVYSGKMFRT
jgi:hypothetical protein